MMIGVIGCGNMASAIVKGFHSADKSQKFKTYDLDFEKAKLLASELKGEAVESLDGLDDVDHILIACKPQHFEGLVKNLKQSKLTLQSKHFISIMAAISISKIEKELESQNITRVMPNMPAQFGKGVTLLMHHTGVKSHSKDLVKRFFDACGVAVEIQSEEVFDKTTVVTGSGPAYVYLFAKTMCDELETYGVSGNDARLMVNQLFVGSSELMSQKDNDLQELIDQVTSKGGVTIEAVNSYKENDIFGMTKKALKKAYMRSIEMTKSFS
jgi:pyrroline-5-carboxylate reductase